LGAGWRSSDLGLSRSVCSTARSWTATLLSAARARIRISEARGRFDLAEHRAPQAKRSIHRELWLGWIAGRRQSQSCLRAPGLKDLRSPGILRMRQPPAFSHAVAAAMDLAP